MELDALTAAIDALAASDPARLADGESLEALGRQLARLEAVVTAATASFDASGAWALDGARTAAAWLATRCRIPKGEARRRVRRGRSLRHLAGFFGAWADGELTGAHLDAVAAVRRGSTEGALARDEALLVGHATTLSFASFTRAVAYFEQLADPDGTEGSAEARHRRRDVWLESTMAGMWLGQITLDPVSGAIVAGELGRLEAALFEADWAEARRRLGREPTATELARTSSERRADALVEMATRSKTAPANGRRPEPLFSVLVDFETLSGRICELAAGTVVSPGALVAWLERAVVERAVFAPPNRVEVSARARLFTGATRRAVELRDRECTHPYCDEPAPGCEVDHIVAFAAGGLTTQDNGRLLCGFHNRLRNQRPPPGG